MPSKITKECLLNDMIMFTFLAIKEEYYSN